MDEIKKLVKKGKTRFPYPFATLGHMIGNVKAVISETKEKRSKISIYKNID
jgi:hypothetical protein